MCLLLFAIHPNETLVLAVAANRDEFYGRPSKSADFWSDHPGLLAGKDEQMGGTWLGITRSGRFAAVTNFKEDPPVPMPPKSRGELPRNFLLGNESPGVFSRSIATHGDDYRGFNLLTSDNVDFYYYGNRAGSPLRLDNGCYGLSNQLLDCDWPKVVSGRKKLDQLMSVDANVGYYVDGLFTLLMDTGDNREFSNSFIKSEEYGTRAATVVLMLTDGRVVFEERTFGIGGLEDGKRQFTFTLDACS